LLTKTTFKRIEYFISFITFSFVKRQKKLQILFQILKVFIYLQHCSIKYKMHKKNIIKKIASFVMLLVFVISITPTVFFHNWLAKHTDSIRKSFTVSKEQVGKKTYHCNCNTLVVESPFKPSINHIILTSQPIFSIPQLYKTVYLFNSYSAFHLLRGPPVV